MKIITLGGFTDEEKENQKRIVYHNIKLGLQELIKQAERTENPIEPSNLKHGRYFSQLDNIETEWNDKLSKKARSLWTDPGIQKAWKNDHNFQIQISHIAYFMENLERIADPLYIPNNEDMLRSRHRTTGEQTTAFIQDKIKWELIDCGGQKPERSKWEGIIGSRESVNAIIFFVSLDEYNVISNEDTSKTRMQISYESWRDILKSDVIKDKPITLLLFLNKIDLLTTKLTSQPDKEDFERTFPKFTGEIESATEAVKKKYTANLTQEVNSHVMCALDTGLMEIIFRTIKDTIFSARMFTAGYKL